MNKSNTPELLAYFKAENSFKLFKETVDTRSIAKRRAYEKTLGGTDVIARKAQTLRQARRRHRYARLLAATALTLLACGSRRDEDEKTKQEQQGTLPADGQTLVIAGDTKSDDALPVGKGCETDLSQSSTFDPSSKDSPVRIVFQGRIEASCLKGKTPEVLLAARSKLELPGATCGPASGDFNIRCAGNIVRADEAGRLSLSFDAKDNLEQLRALRVKVRYR